MIEAWLIVLYLPSANGALVEYPPRSGFPTEAACLEAVPGMFERQFSLDLDSPGVMPVRAECRPIVKVYAAPPVVRD